MGSECYKDLWWNFYDLKKVDSLISDLPTVINYLKFEYKYKFWSY